MSNTPARNRMEPGHGLSRRQRVVRTAHFAEAYAAGRRCRGRLMTLWLRESHDNQSLRLGVVTSRRIGNAVKRVRARRIMRETYRRLRHRFSGSFDVILQAGPAIAGANAGEVEAELIALARKSGILVAEKEES